MKKLSIGIMFLGLLLAPFMGSKAFANIVQTNDTYTYDMMEKDLDSLDKQFKDLIEVYNIGDTPYGRDLYLVKVGYGDANVIYNGSHHAREWLTTTLNMKMMERYAQAYNTNSSLGGYNVKDLLHKTTMWFVPMVNPDGVTLQQFGLDAFPKSVHNELISMNNGSSNFKRWKANAQGIDLNRQYPAGWDSVIAANPTPSWKNYKGDHPFQAPEAKVMRDITYILDPDITLAYHTAGQILYWNFNVEQSNLARDRRIASKFSTASGYRMVDTHSGAGYTDWINQDFDQPGLTPELAVYPGETNVDPSKFQEAWVRNKHAGLAMANEGVKIHTEKERNTEQETVYVDQKAKTDILPNNQAAPYDQVQNVKESYHLTLAESVKLYSWYQNCQACSLQDQQAADIFDKLVHFTEKDSKKDVTQDKTWNITLNTEIDESSVSKENIYVMNEDGEIVTNPQMDVDDKRILITSPKANYQSGETYTLYVKDLVSTKGKKMEKPVEMTFTIQ
ncbi:M14 family zinc carboxypeptidase [Pontibacillus yanchengensis]|uniref:Gamma-D-glutamyl-meso-diaminopimelate peptidase n=1 Tax=Pontibacillus yanchengensis Y32 TaxID=1385514 RepID=A0A0A2TFV7_9BACI|nr:M14 family zinc carboxypeptidase [Pontibacillus yanchengensis]KGP73318.1 gamma-D-glutamyl-meso-diaminopimelate peptidase [Pontibacillus yanchengensis Y32]